MPIFATTRRFFIKIHWLYYYKFSFKLLKGSLAMQKVSSLEILLYEKRNNIKNGFYHLNQSFY